MQLLLFIQQQAKGNPINYVKVKYVTSLLYKKNEINLGIDDF